MKTATSSVLPYPALGNVPLGLLAMAVGAFGIGLTEFVIMGLLPEVSEDLGVSLSVSGLLISGYALGVVVGAPLLTLATRRWPQKRTLLLLMVVFTLGNLLCATAPGYFQLMGARVVTAFAHGTFFGVGAMVAAQLVPRQRSGSAIAIVFTGLTLANVLGVPFGTWIGQAFGWRWTFGLVAIVGLAALMVLWAWIPPAFNRPAPAADSGSSVRRLFRLPVMLGFGITVLGFGGTFALLTFIAPLLTDVSGFAATSVAPLLVLFGIGVLFGNLLGGRLVDRFPTMALIGSLAALTLILATTALALVNPISATLWVFLLGLAAFSTCTPLQVWVMSRADATSQTLASSLNIAAFNLGNAIGAAIAGWVLTSGGGLTAIPLVAASMPFLAIAVGLMSLRLEAAEALRKASHDGV